MSHIYYYYRAINGKEMPASEEFTGDRDQAIERLKARFVHSATPISRILPPFKNRSEAEQMLAALKASFAKSRSFSMQHSLKWQIAAVKADLGDASVLDRLNAGV